MSKKKNQTHVLQVPRHRINLSHLYISSRIFLLSSNKLTSAMKLKQSLNLTEWVITIAQQSQENVMSYVHFGNNL